MTESARCSLWCPVCGHETRYADTVYGAEDELARHVAQDHPDWTMSSSGDGAPTLTRVEAQEPA